MPNQTDSIKHVPIRTCVGCGQKAAQSLLIRLAKTSAGAIVVDFKRKYPGRGAWVHADTKCAKNAVRSSRLWRTLRVPVNAASSASAEAKQELLNELLQASCLYTREATGLTDYESG